MVTVHQIKQGIASYLDHEILPQINGWQKWVAGVVIAEYLSKADKVIESILASPSIAILELADDNKRIDIDRLKDRFLDEARKTGDIYIKLPMLGELKVGEADVHKLYQHITEAH